MYSYGPLHMAVQKQGSQVEPTHSSSVRIQGVAQGTYGKQGTIGRGGEMMMMKYIWYVDHIFWITFRNKPKLILLHTIKWFQVFLSKTNNSINY